MIFAAAVLVIGALVFTLGVRAKDLPAPEPVSPTRHLEERKAAIYENLRDLQFEYRVGKLSDQDYQQTKQDLQKELAAVLAEIDALTAATPPSARAAAAPAPAPKKKPRDWYHVPALRGEVRNGVEVLRRVRQADSGGGIEVRALALFVAAAAAFGAVDGTVTNQTTGKPQAGRDGDAVQTDAGRAASGGGVKTDAQGRFATKQDTGQEPLLLQTAYQGVTYNHMLPPGTPRPTSR